MEKSAEPLDRETARLEKKAGTVDFSDPEKRSSAAIDVNVAEEFLREHEKQYRSLKTRVWADLESTGFSESGQQEIWREHWSARNVTADPVELRRRLEAYSKHVSVSSAQLDAMIARGVYEWLKSIGPNALPSYGTTTATLYPRIIHRRFGGLRFKLAGETKFEIHSRPGKAVAGTRTYGIVLDQAFVLDGKALSSGTKLDRRASGKWVVRP